MVRAVVKKRARAPRPAASGRPLTVIDFHTHARLGVEDLGPWLDYAKACGIGRIVLLTDVLAFGAAQEAAQVRAINDHSFRLAARHPGFCKSFCYVNPTLEPDECLEEIERCRGLGAVGVKMEASTWASDPRLAPIMKRLEQTGLPLLHHSWNTRTLGRIDVNGYHQSDSEDIAALAARFPRVTIVAAHLRPNGLRGIWEVRAHRNVLFDTSGGQPVSAVIEAAVRLLGPERVIYGSDAYFPEGRDFSSQLACIEAARISDKARELILGGNARRVLGEAS